MLEPTPGGSVHPQFPNPTPTGPGFGGAPDDRTERVLSPAVIHLRRLYYYLELLAAGYRHALKPEPLVRSLRAERIALGIDLPELDTVPLWSVRRQDGSMSIPFIEFILGQIGDSLESFCGTVETAPPQAIEKLMEDRRAVAGMLEETAPAGEPLPLLPRLKDVFVPESLLERLYKADGMFEEIARRCVAVLIATREGPGH